MKWNFNKFRVFITGSSSGLGLGLAKNFLENNAEVIINGRNSTKLLKASIMLKNCNYIKGDVSNKKDIKKIKNFLKKKNNSIDLMICNVGDSEYKNNNLDFENAFKSNFFSTVNCVEILAPLIKKNGKIICISSICGSEVIDGAPIGYSIAKSAINNYVKSISYELGKKNISINSIAPGNLYFKNSTWEKKLNKNKLKTLRYIKNNVVLNRFGNIDDIYNLIAYLSSTKTKFVTGSTFVIDGGQIKKF